MFSNKNMENFRKEYLFETFRILPQVNSKLFKLLLLEGSHDSPKTQAAVRAIYMQIL